MRLCTPILFLMLMSLQGSSTNDRADEIAVPQPPQICKLSVTRVAGTDSVSVKWSGGAAPFTVIRADGPCFGEATELKYLSQNVSGHSYLDRHALGAKRRFWYQVYDANSGIQIFSLSSGEAKESDPNTIHPNGTGECGDDAWCGELRRSPTTWK